MTHKDWLRFFVAMSPAQCREMGELLISIADDGPRDAVREERLQQAIEALPKPPDNGLAETLRQARLAAHQANPEQAQ